MRREEVLPISVVLKGTRLPYEPVDDVAVLDAVAVLTTQTWQTVHARLPVPDLQMIAVEANFNLLTNQAAVNRVGIVFYPDRARWANFHADAFGCIELLLWQVHADWEALLPIVLAALR